MKKPTTYTEGNITLEQAKGGGYYLSVADVLGDSGNLIAIEEEEIERICDVCLRWLVDNKKPVKK